MKSATGLPANRREAIEIGSAIYCTGRLCKRGHNSPRRTDNKTCVECANEARRAKRAADPEFVREKARAAYAANPDSAKASAKRYRKKNPEKAREKVRTWHRRNQVRMKEHRASYRENNPERVKEVARNYYAENKEKLKERCRAWRLANPDAIRSFWVNRRARKKSAEGFHTGADISRIRVAQRDRCANPVCRVKLNDGGHVDHITPLARGGSNWPRNLQLLCESCNCSKSARDPIEFAQSKGLLL